MAVLACPDKWILVGVAKTVSIFLSAKKEPCFHSSFYYQYFLYRKRLFSRRPILLHLADFSCQAGGVWTGTNSSTSNNSFLQNIERTLGRRAILLHLSGSPCQYQRRVVDTKVYHHKCPHLYIIVLLYQSYSRL